MCQVFTLPLVGHYAVPEVCLHVFGLSIICMNSEAKEKLPLDYGKK